MRRNRPMSKTQFNGIHLDLSDVSLIGQLTKNDEGIWFAPVVWRNTGQTINLKMSAQKDRYSILVTPEDDPAEREARDNYDRLVRDWKACE